MKQISKKGNSLNGPPDRGSGRLLEVLDREALEVAANQRNAQLEESVAPSSLHSRLTEFDVTL